MQHRVFLEHTEPATVRIGEAGFEQFSYVISFRVADTIFPQSMIFPATGRCCLKRYLLQEIEISMLYFSPNSLLILQPFKDLNKQKNSLLTCGHNGTQRVSLHPVSEVRNSVVSHMQRVDEMLGKTRVIFSPTRLINSLMSTQLRFSILYFSWFTRVTSGWQRRRWDRIILSRGSDKTNQMTCAPSKDLDQPGHSAQSDQSLHCSPEDGWSTLCWAHKSFCWFCRGAAQYSHFIAWYVRHCCFSQIY